MLPKYHDPGILGIASLLVLSAHLSSGSTWRLSLELWVAPAGEESPHPLRPFATLLGASRRAMGAAPDVC